MRKIGVFGGTFDPVHYGHIHLALSLKESRGIDLLFFSPNYISPSKQEFPPKASPKQRFDMLVLALEGIPDCRVLDYEINRIGPSYTIDLIRYVKSSFCRKEDLLFLFLAEDLLDGFSYWKESSEIVKLASPLVGCRDRAFSNTEYQDVFEKGKVHIPVMEISSTFVRHRLKNKLYCGHLVPAKVLDYIHENKLY